MLKEDQKRLEREADIAKSTRGPTPSQTDIDIKRNYDDLAKRMLAQRQADEKRYGWSPELGGEALTDYLKTRGRGRS